MPQVFRVAPRNQDVNVVPLHVPNGITKRATTMGVAMRSYRVFAVGVLAFPLLLASGVAAGCDTSTGVTRCTRPDSGAPCALGTTAEREGATGWLVVLRATVVSDVEYNDGGFVCSYQRTQCRIGLECHFSGVANWTASQAIAECQARA